MSQTDDRQQQDGENFLHLFCSGTFLTALLQEWNREP